MSNTNQPSKKGSVIQSIPLVVANKVLSEIEKRIMDMCCTLEMYCNGREQGYMITYHFPQPIVEPIALCGTIAHRQARYYGSIAFGASPKDSRIFVHYGTKMDLSSIYSASCLHDVAWPIHQHFSILETELAAQFIIEQLKLEAETPPSELQEEKLFEDEL